MHDFATDKPTGKSPNIYKSKDRVTDYVQLESDVIKDREFLKKSQNIVSR